MHLLTNLLFLSWNNTSNGNNQRVILRWNIIYSISRWKKQNKQRAELSFITEGWAWHTQEPRQSPNILNQSHDETERRRIEGPSQQLMEKLHTGGRGSCQSSIGLNVITYFHNTDRNPLKNSYFVRTIFHFKLLLAVGKK